MMRLTCRATVLIISLTAGLMLSAMAVIGTASASITRNIAGHKETTNLVLNGSFERPDCSPAYCEFDGGSTAIPHWVVGGNSVDVASYWQPARGSQSVDLSGSASGSVRQKVATTLGDTYALKWYLAGNSACGQPIKTMHVYWNGKLVDSLKFNTTGHNGSDMGWVSRDITVKAKGSTSTIEFADATPDHSACGATLDAVSLKQT